MCKFFNSYEESLHWGVCKLAKYVRNCVVFWKNLHSWQKFYTTAGRDGRDKFQVCWRRRPRRRQLSGMLQTFINTLYLIQWYKLEPKTLGDLINFFQALCNTLGDQEKSIYIKGYKWFSICCQHHDWNDFPPGTRNTGLLTWEMLTSTDNWHNWTFI